MIAFGSYLFILGGHMKRLAAAVVLVGLLFSAPLMALDLGLGMGIGLNIGGLSYENLETAIEANENLYPYGLIGITLGAVARAQILPIFGVQAEAMFTLTGGGSSFEIFPEDDEIELWYIERDTYFIFQFPLLAYFRVPVPLFGGWFPAPHVGISYDMLIGSAPSREEFFAESRFGNSQESSDYDPAPGEWRRWATSWVAGLDFETQDESLIGGVGLRLMQQFSGFGPEDGTEAEQRLLTNFSISVRGVNLF